METLLHCPSCFGKAHLPFIETKDYSVTGESFTILRCLFCGFKFTNPRPTEAEALRYYDSASYVSHTGTRQGIINFVYHLVRRITVYNKARLIKQLIKGKMPGKVRLLDFGSGTGDFLAACKKRGFQVTGIEPSKQARENTRLLHELDVLGPDGLSAVRHSTFDIITLWHVLEHVQDIDVTFRALIQLMAPDGLMVVALPNYTSHDAAYYGKYWAGYDVPRHLYHISPDDFKRFTHMHGLQIIQMIPMHFDAYYVSMLSEKYRGRKVLNGMIRGFISNWKASRNNKAYSSCIYVLKDTHRYSFSVRVP